SLLDLVGTFIFLVGNYLLFTTTTCQKTSPGLFGLSMALVILGYFVITIPVFLCGAVIFCLPCVLMIMRTLGIGEVTGAGATEDDAICCICLSEYEDGQKLRQLYCHHHFHIDCVDEWLKLNRTCPLCKRDI
ncbi:hypothetical protein K493DRAFT_155333, partial [Basidiobolus meristosporus CBS 931.73]